MAAQDVDPAAVTTAEVDPGEPAPTRRRAGWMRLAVAAGRRAQLVAAAATD